MRLFDPFLDGHQHVSVELWEHLRRKTFTALDKHAALKAVMCSPEEVLARGRYAAKTFLASIGGLPDVNGPVVATDCGVLRRGTYRIEKIVYESEPGVYVSSLLYVPDGLNEPAPAVLFLSGHHREAKGNPEYQRVCQDLVMNGFVVLAIDPTGQGERVSHLDPATGEMAIGWGTTEHSFQGQACILTGTNIARYFLFDALRGIDYLQSRSEVDSTRIGVTGNSGGGTQTCLLCMSGDPRIRAAVPCTYLTSREHYWLAGQPQDCEQLQFGMTANGINFDDFLIPFAPRPVLIGAVASDFFNPEGTELTFQRLKHVYKVMGSEENVECVFAPCQHAYCRELRTAAVNWFRMHLKGEPAVFISRDDAAFDTLRDEQLWCTSQGHVVSAFPNARTPYHRNLDMIPPRVTVVSRETVAEVLSIRSRMSQRVSLFPRVIRRQEEEGILAESIIFRAEEGITLAGGLLHRADMVATRATIVLSDGHTEEAQLAIPFIRNRIEAGDAVFQCVVRGRGVVRAQSVNPYGNDFPETFFNSEAWYAWSAYCLKESLLGMRVFDVLRMADCLHELGFECVALYAFGLEPALWAFLAGVLNERLNPVTIVGLPESFESIVRNPLYRKDFVPSMVVHGILQSFDIPNLISFYVGRELSIEYATVQ